MANPSAKACERQKTAIAYEVGNIQGMAERYLSQSDDYSVRKIPEVSVDHHNEGYNPRHIRYSTVPVAEHDYIDPRVTGDANELTPAVGCDGGNIDLDALTNIRGSAGCSIPGVPIHGGYDEFTNKIGALAYETDPMCAFDLLLKGSEHTNAYIRMLRGDLPMRATEIFSRTLNRDIIENGHYNSSVVAGWVKSQGTFPAVPTGVLDVGYVKRMCNPLKKEGWTGRFEMQVSRQAFETMRLNYKKNTGLDLNSTVISPEVHHLGDDVEVIEWNDIRWVISKEPPRGYLEKTADGYRFREIFPTGARLGTGGGVVAGVEDDYYNCFTYCNGKKEELYELGLFVHDTACQREPFGLPQIDTKSWDRNTFNFEVKMVDGAYIDCNEDNFKWYFRMLHAYGFRSLNPELMGGLLYRVSPEVIHINEPVCDGVVTAANVAMSVPPAVIKDACAEAESAPCPEENHGTFDPPPTPENPAPANVPGELEFMTIETFTYTDAGNLVIGVKRIGGTEGAASVNFATADDTASSIGDLDYSDTSGTLNWADGENGRKYITVPITSTGAGGGLKFNINLSGASGAAIKTGSEQAVVTID